MIVAIGSGLSAFLKYRKAAEEIENKAKKEATEGVQNAAEQLQAQYEARIHQYEETIDLLHTANEDQKHMYEERLSNLQAFNATLLAQLLGRHRK